MFGSAVQIATNDYGYFVYLMHYAFVLGNAKRGWHDCQIRFTGDKKILDQPDFEKMLGDVLAKLDSAQQLDFPLPNQFVEFRNRPGGYCDRFAKVDGREFFLGTDSSLADELSRLRRQLDSELHLQWLDAESAAAARRHEQDLGVLMLVGPDSKYDKVARAALGRVSRRFNIAGFSRSANIGLDPHDPELSRMRDALNHASQYMEGRR